MNHPILELIQQGEHQQLDFKFQISDSKKIARSLVAFANTDGGRLLIGVKDNGRIAGVRSEEEFHMIEAAAQLYSKPPVPYEHQQWQIEGKTVLEIMVHPSDKKPHFALNEDEAWRPYQRRDDENLMGNRILAKVWGQQKIITDQTISLTDDDLKMFKILGEKEYFSFNQFCKISKRHFKKAEILLVKLICWEIIELLFTDTGCRYRLIPDKDYSKIVK